MVKTGWKYTKQQPDKNKTNMIKRSASSSKPNRIAPKNGGRTQETIKRLKMYSNGKAIRNKEGKIVGGQFMMKDRAGDTEITAATGRIQPDRRWFGNTRVVNPTDLDKFREQMNEKASDPYSIVLKRKKLPMGLLQDAALASQNGSATSGLLANEPFDKTFGKKHRRKRVKLDQYMTHRKQLLDMDRERKIKKKEMDAGVGLGGGEATIVSPSSLTDHDNNDENPNSAGYAALMNAAQTSSKFYNEVNNASGIVPWGRDSNLEVKEGEGVDWRKEKKDDLFLKGQSRRIWGEFYKVIDCSDVILHVIDARNVPGTRCTMIERHVGNNAKHKHLIFVLNKIDLVPNWVAKRWIGVLSAVRPTIAFHASMTHAFGKGALISLLRQFGKLHEDKQMISVGVIGYPNVGKSSVINTLISKKSCKVAPVPGETKIWQYISLFKRISLIDCPGVVVNTADDTETDSVLKGVVRAERLENPEDFIPAILEQVKREHIAAQYSLPKSGEKTWTDHLDLLAKISLRSGKLLKGGEPCIRSSAITMINDYQRGKLPHYVPPPELKDNNDDNDSNPTKFAAIDGIEIKNQNLDKIGEEHLKNSDLNPIPDADMSDNAKKKDNDENENTNDQNCDIENDEDEEQEDDSEDEENNTETLIIEPQQWDDDN